ncbi:hypothetical protein ACOBV8_05950 [Pseudoalteromonas espejiana]
MSSFAKNKSIEFINLVAEEAEIKAKAALDVDFLLLIMRQGLFGFLALLGLMVLRI